MIFLDMFLQIALQRVPRTASLTFVWSIIQVDMIVNYKILATFEYFSANNTLVIFIQTPVFSFISIRFFVKALYSLNLRLALNWFTFSIYFTYRFQSGPKAKVLLQLWLLCQTQQWLALIFVIFAYHLLVLVLLT